MNSRKKQKRYGAPKGKPYLKIIKTYQLILINRISFWLSVKKARIKKHRIPVILKSGKL